MLSSTHPHWLFPKDLSEAQAAQQEMAHAVLLKDVLEKPITHIAGMDVSNQPFDPEQMIFGSAVVLSYPSLEIVETATHTDRQEFPYIPGFLGFREAPALVQVYERLLIKPNLILVDGHGIVQYKHIAPMTMEVWQREFVPRIQKASAQ